MRRAGPVASLAALFGGVTLLGACTAQSPAPAPSSAAGASGNASQASAPMPSSTRSLATSVTGSPTTGSDSPGGQTLRPGESTVPPSASTPETSMTLTGPVVVNEAQQDPLSGVLQRGSLRHTPVTLDVTLLPDSPVDLAGSPVVVVSGTHGIARGAGLHLTITPTGSVSAADGGQVRLHGTFTVEMTDPDAFTLRG